MQIQISWLFQKPTDLDLHCLQRQGISGFSRTRVNQEECLFSNTVIYLTLLQLVLSALLHHSADFIFIFFIFCFFWNHPAYSGILAIWSVTLTFKLNTHSDLSTVHFRYVIQKSLHSMQNRLSLPLEVIQIKYTILKKTIKFFPFEAKNT